MEDIIIDGVTYDLVTRTTIDGINYVVFEDEEGIYVCEYVVQNDEIFFKTISDEMEDKVLNTLGIDYE